MDDEWIKLEEYPDFKYRKKILSNGQCAIFGLVRWSYDKTVDYSVIFAIADKFKAIKKWMLCRGYGNLDTIKTGKCGLEGVIWAKENVIEFTKEVREWNDSHWLKKRIVIEATTPERFRLYKRALVPVGFKEHRCNGVSKLIYE